MDVANLRLICQSARERDPEYGEFGIKVRLKLTCKPGEQFVVRRRAHALMVKAFAANDIKFAVPTVQVAGGEAPMAAAHASLKAVPKPAA